MASGIRHGILWRILVQGFLGVIFEAQGIFWVFIFAPIGISLSLEIRGTPPPPGVDQHEISPCNINALRKQSCHEN